MAAASTSHLLLSSSSAVTPPPTTKPGRHPNLFYVRPDNHPQQFPEPRVRVSPHHTARPGTSLPTALLFAPPESPQWNSISLQLQPLGHGVPCFLDQARKRVSQESKPSYVLICTKWIITWHEKRHISRPNVMIITMWERHSPDVPAQRTETCRSHVFIIASHITVIRHACPEVSSIRIHLMARLPLEINLRHALRRVSD
jgi:hypothetical protein